MNLTAWTIILASLSYGFPKAFTARLRSTQNVKGSVWISIACICFPEMMRFTLNKTMVHWAYNAYIPGRHSSLLFRSNSNSVLNLYRSVTNHVVKSMSNDCCPLRFYLAVATDVKTTVRNPKRIQREVQNRYSIQGWIRSRNRLWNYSRSNWKLYVRLRAVNSGRWKIAAIWTETAEKGRKT